MSDDVSLPRPRVFISHQWADKHIADRLQQALGQIADVWLDIRNLAPGRSIKSQIDAALATMDAMVVLWSRNSAQSEGVRDEIATARRLGLLIYPVTLEHGEDGRPVPALPPKLKGILGLEMHHYALTAARLLHEIFKLQLEKLPPQVRESMLKSESTILMGAMVGDVSALKYCNATERGKREYWVEKISERMAAFVSHRDPEEARRLIEDLERRKADNPDYEILCQAFQRTAAKRFGRIRPSADSPQQGEPPPLAPDLLRRRLRDLLPANQVEMAAEAVESYVQAAPPILAALESFVVSRSSPAGALVVTTLQNFLREANDLIPDHLGTFGLVDDAWLINNTAYRLVEAGIVPAQAIPANLAMIAQADAIARAIMPPGALQALTELLMQLLQHIAAEVQAYQPQMLPFGRGYQPWASGGSWEDQMNRALLGTGLSVDF